MTRSANVATSLRAFIADEMLMGQGMEFSDDDALIEEGVIDSLGLLEIVTFIETEFDVVVADDDVSLDAFGSVSLMAAYVESLLSHA